MFQIVLKSFLVFAILECLVRVFHLYSDNPKQFVDDFGVRKHIPYQEGYNVTGNRKQHVTPYKINKNGFNTVTSEPPSNHSYNIAIIGDSYIEGMHQPYFNSLGKMLESKFDTIRVYEYGISGYDMADQLHLIQAYSDEFENIDAIILYMKFENDFERSVHEPGLVTESKFDHLRNQSKLLTYLRQLGLLNNFKTFLTTANQHILNGHEIQKEDSADLNHNEIALKRISNFKKLIQIYGFNNKKIKLLLDSRYTNVQFIAFCKQNGIEIIDFKKAFQTAKNNTSLVYDAHWNDYGRSLIADTIFQHFSKNN